MRHVLVTTVFILLCVLCVRGATAAEGHNYAELLQKNLYFFEAQESGHLSPGNRVVWRSNATMNDGAEVGLELSGGWNDAGDHWKANSTMAQGASFLAWSIITFPESYTDTGQMPHALNTLRHIVDYFRRCVVDPQPEKASNFAGYEVYVDVGGKTTPEAPLPGVHSPWCAAGALDGFTVREPLKVNAATPNADATAAMAATLASAAQVFHLHGTAADRALAAEVLPIAEKLTAFSTAYPTSTKQAIRPNGLVVTNGYLGDYPADDLVWARVWLHRCSTAMAIPGYTNAHLEAARTVLNALNAAGTLGDFTAWWRERSYNHASMMAWLQTDHTQADADRLLPPLRQLLLLWDEANPNASPATSKFYNTPFGLRVRQVYGGTFTGQNVFRQLQIAAMFAAWTQDAGEQTRYREYVQAQCNYFLGDNKQGISYIVGYGNNGWPTTLHHRDAHGSWNGHTQRSTTDALYLGRMRHVLYGALIGGPDGNDDFTDGTFDHVYTETTITSAGQVQVVAAYLRSLYPDQQPVAGFPPAPSRDLSLNLDFTDREFYVGARTTSSDAGSLSVSTTVYNRSAWPARVTDDTRYRYYFTADAGEQSASDFTLSVSSSDGGTSGGIVHVGGHLFYAEVRFTGERMLPDYRHGRQQWKRNANFTLSAQSGTFDTRNDWSADGLDGTTRLQPRLPVFQATELLEGELPVSGPLRTVTVAIAPSSAAQNLLAEADGATVEEIAPGSWRATLAVTADLLLHFVFASDG